MKRRFALAVSLVALVSSFTITGSAFAADAPAKMAWYVPAPHPYFDAVKSGVDAFEKEFKIPVKQQFGPDWNMDSQNTGMLALAAGGYNYFATYPADASAANGLYDEIVKRKTTIQSLPLLASQEHQCWPLVRIVDGSD